MGHMSEDEDLAWLHRLSEAGVTAEDLESLGGLLQFAATLNEAGEKAHLRSGPMAAEKAKLLRGYLDYLKRNI